MKKIQIILSAVLCMLCFSACETDNDSNPVLTDATEFVLNLPSYASTIYDLQNSQVVEFTCSHPEFGFPLALNYYVQVSLDGTFNEAVGEDVAATYKTLPTVYNSTKINVDASEMAIAIVELTGIEDEDEFNAQYKDPIKVFVRLNATTSNGLKPTLSNVIELPKVATYFALSPVVMPEEMYIIGTFVNWEWDKAYSMVPVHSTPGKFWRIMYLAADAKLKFNSVKDWNGGDVGYAGTEFPNPTYAGVGEEDGNIKIANAGWYIVVISTEIIGRDFAYTVDFLEPNVYLYGLAAGDVWAAGDDNRFTVPETDDGEFVSPAFIGNVPSDSDSGVRACIVLEGHEWWHTEFIVINGKIEYRGAGGDQDRVPGSIGQRLYFNFAKGEGRIQ